MGGFIDLESKPNQKQCRACIHREKYHP